MAFMEYVEMYYIVYGEVGTTVNVCIQCDDLETPEIAKKDQYTKNSRSN